MTRRAKALTWYISAGVSVLILTTILTNGTYWRTCPSATATAGIICNPPTPLKHPYVIVRLWPPTVHIYSPLDVPPNQ